MRWSSAACLELVERVDPELGLQAHGGLRPDAGNAEHVEEHLGRFLAELVQIIDLAALEVLGDLGGEVLPDSGKLEERALRGDILDRAREPLDVLRAAPVGVHAENILAAKLENVRDFVEEVGDFPVLHTPSILAQARRCGKR